jgi:uncharacterized membrane protein YcaP (DUF421 family)
MRILFHMPRLNATLQGRASCLILNGKVDFDALRRETLTEEELLSVLHKQSFDTFEEVRRCVLEPNGTFFIEAVKPNRDEKELDEVLAAVRSLTADVAALREELRRRDAGHAANP